MPTPVYLHMKCLACQQLQAVDKGFVSLVISWIYSMFFFEQKREGKEITIKMSFHPQFLTGC